MSEVTDDRTTLALTLRREEEIVIGEAVIRLPTNHIGPTSVRVVIEAPRSVAVGRRTRTGKFGPGMAGALARLDAARERAGVKT